MIRYYRHGLATASAETRRTAQRLTMHGWRRCCLAEWREARQESDRRACLAQPSRRVGCDYTAFRAAGAERGKVYPSGWKG